MERLNRQSASIQLETVVTNEIRVIKVNTLKIVMAVHGQHVGALRVLREVTGLDVLQMVSRIPLSFDVITGVIYDVELAILRNYLPILVKAASS